MKPIKPLVTVLMTLALSWGAVGMETACCKTDTVFVDGGTVEIHDTTLYITEIHVMIFKHSATDTAWDTTIVQATNGVPDSASLERLGRLAVGWTDTGWIPLEGDSVFADTLFPVSIAAYSPLVEFVCELDTIPTFKARRGTLR